MEIMLLIKLTHPLVIVKDRNKLGCVIILWYFLVMSFFLIIISIILFSLDFNIVIVKYL